MALIATEPIRIGDHLRQPGYRLTEGDMAGRNIGAMKRQGVVRFVDDAELDRRPQGKRSGE